MKTRIFYCPNCKKEKRLEAKRQWCDCYNPPFEMAWHSKNDDIQMMKSLDNWVKNMKGAV